ncbi:MAG: hypothetical protein MMC33_001944 [Icmadophila ericetorum]|nr:hypothetical protein [Icmadophila ericetorum]
MAPRTVRKSMASRPKVKAHREFLSLPLEIRQHVYGTMSMTMPDSLPALIQSSRQIHREAQPFLYKQPLIFDGQGDFMDWLRSIDREFLRYVTIIRFKLYDIDPDKIVGALGERLRRARLANNPGNAIDNPYDEACDLVVRRIGEAFSHMENVKEFTILECDETDPHPSLRMLISFANEVARRFPSLLTLDVQTDLIPVNFVSNFTRLRSLYHPGFSISNPRDTKAVLQNLQNLTSLSVTSPSPELSFQQRPGYTGPLRIQCIDVSVLESLPNLTYLSICDSLDVTAGDPKPYFINPDLFEALADAPLTSLTTLRLATNHPTLPFQTILAFWEYLCDEDCGLLSLDLAFLTDVTLIDATGKREPLEIIDLMSLLKAKIGELINSEDTRLMEVRVCRTESEYERRKKIRRDFLQKGLSRVNNETLKIKWGLWEDWFREGR